MKIWNANFEDILKKSINIRMFTLNFKYFEHEKPKILNLNTIIVKENFQKMYLRWAKATNLYYVIQNGYHC